MRTGKTLVVIILAVIAMAFLALPCVCLSGETERVRIAAAKTRAALITQAELPSTPPNVVLPTPKRKSAGIPAAVNAIREAVGAASETLVSATATLPELVANHQPEAGERTEPRNPRVVMIHAKWCHPCNVSLDGTRDRPELGFRKWLKAAGWEISSSHRAHVQLIDVDEHTSAMAQYGVTSLPTFILIEDGRERKRHVGQASRQTILDLFAARSDNKGQKGGEPRFSGPVADGATAVGPTVSVAGVQVVPWYESVSGRTVQPTDEHLLHHGFTRKQIAGMRHEERCFWHGLAHQLEAK
jgi:thiol-disulfide isomerase/thioredoxin